MTSTRHKLGELITQYSERCGNRNVRYSDISGVNRDKEFFPSKLVGENISNYKVVPFGYFACNLMHVGRDVVLPIAYNNSEHDVFVSPAYTVFSIKEDAPLEPRYLEMWFKSDERDRYFWMHTDSSIRDGMTFDDMCDIEIDLPPIGIQKKYVDIYNAMLKNQESYEKGLTDLKITCDAYIDILKHSRDGISISNFITQIDNRNKSNNPYAFKGLSMNNYFIDSIANANGLDFSNYKIVAPNEYCAVLMKVGRDKRLTIARNDSNENYLVSPAYYTFKTSKIDSNYFMVTVNRSEFERRGWFSCDTSARGSLPWDEFLNLVIPNADNNEQAIISKLYRVLIERTDINNKLKGCIKDICPILIKGSLEEANK